jgi:hypothetical protein
MDRKETKKHEKQLKKHQKNEKLTPKTMADTK